MKQILLFVFAFVLSIAFIHCGSHSHEHKHEHEQHLHKQVEPLMLTAYSDSLEVFVEVGGGGFHEGKETFIIAYITKLNNFKPLNISEVTFSLIIEDNIVEAIAKQQAPGIYRCNIVPVKNGKGKLVCKVLMSNEVNETVIPVSVCGHAEHHHHHVSEGSHNHNNMVAFSKEQSWKVNFATDTVGVSHVSKVVKGAGIVSNVPENVTTIVAVSNGKIHYGSKVAVGRFVKSGETLFVMETGDVSDGNAAIKFAEAESRYNYAKAEYERKAELVKTKIVSLSDFQAAEAAYVQAKAIYENLNKNFKSGKVFLKSPMEGYISDIAVSSGEFVTEGMPVATLQCDDGTLQLFCEVSVRHADVLRNIVDVNIELNDGTCYSLNELQGIIVGVGRGVQNDCNMIPVTVIVKNLNGVVPGNIVNMYLVASTQNKGIVVPRTALVEEMGRFFIFVQHTPVMFEKRIVTPGVTDGKNVQIIDGIEQGERIVSVGAVFLKLSQGAGTLDPHAGHVH